MYQRTIFQPTQRILVQKGNNVNEAITGFHQELEKCPQGSTISSFTIVPEMIMVNDMSIVRPGQSPQGHAQMIYAVIGIVNVPDAAGLQISEADQNDVRMITHTYLEALQANFNRFTAMFTDAVKEYQHHVTATMQQTVIALDELRETVLQVNQDKGGK